MKGLFITGTDTGVGKTFVGIGLITAIKRAGISVSPMKPVETGCHLRDGRLIPPDTVRLLEASGVDEPLDIVNPYRFRQPLAPMVAAEIEGRRIQRKRILSIYRYLSMRYDMVVMEGAGGIMVPLNRGYLYLDLVKDLGIPLLIVSRATLGTINHSLLTIEVARRKGIEIIGVIINHAVQSKRGLAEKTNPEVIERLGEIDILGEIPYIKEHNPCIKKRLFNDITKRIINKYQ